jgi:hypothetical protein
MPATPAGLRELQFAGVSTNAALASAAYAPLAALLTAQTQQKAAGGTLYFQDQQQQTQQNGAGQQQVQQGTQRSGFNWGTALTIGIPAVLLGVPMISSLFRSARSGAGLFSGALGGQLALQGPGAAAGALMLLAFKVNGKPVRAEFSNKFASHALAVHYEGRFPTSRAYCYLSDDKKSRYGDSEHCLQMKEIANQGRVCPRSQTACLLVKPSPEDIPNTLQQAGVPGYTAVLVVNKNDFKTREVLASIFQQELPPVSAADGTGMIANLVAGAGGDIGDVAVEPTQAELDAVQQQIVAANQQVEQNARNEVARAETGVRNARNNANAGTAG